MKQTLKLVAAVIALVMCVAGSIVVVKNDLQQGPLSADDITDGRLSEMMAYEQFGDFLSDSQIPEGIPLKLTGPTVTYRPIGNYGCMAIQNPFIARNEDGDELFSVVKAPGHHIISVVVDGYTKNYTYDISPKK